MLALSAEAAVALLCAAVVITAVSLPVHDLSGTVLYAQATDFAEAVMATNSLHDYAYQDEVLGALGLEAAIYVDGEVVRAAHIPGNATVQRTLVDGGRFRDVVFVVGRR